VFALKVLAFENEHVAAPVPGQKIGNAASNHAAADNDDFSLFVHGFSKPCAGLDGAGFSDSRDGERAPGVGPG
jgi:hypothetical protein